MQLTNQPKSYSATKLDEPFSIDNLWNKKPWKGIEPLELDHYMGTEPFHRPKVQVKVAYDEDALYVIYRVHDQYVRSIRTNFQDPVYKDSAVEFFFCPSDSDSKGYFNLEINCGGTALFRFKSPEKRKVLIPESEFQKLEISHSLPKVVEPEIQEPVTWTLEFKLPFDIIKHHYAMTNPKSGDKWRVNFYKIADESSHPHYLTWSEVIHPKPNFHLPQYFGTLVFE